MRSRMFGMVAAFAALGQTFCFAATTINIVDSIGNVGYSPALAIGKDGLPIISYLQQIPNTNAANLKIAKCASESCSDIDHLTIIASSIDMYNGGIVVPADGLPVLSYVANQTLFVIKCVDTACLSVSGAKAISTPAPAQDSRLVVGQDGRCQMF
jgi:hypothetical protein